jgi:hypothetical protein
VTADHACPWIRHPDGPEELPSPPEPVNMVKLPVLTGPAAPQPGVPQPDAEMQLPQVRHALGAELWWAGAHGGAGESILASLAPTWRAAGHAWPYHEDGSTARVVLVCRSHASGLLHAQAALTQWAAGLVLGVELLGLVVVADAPGRLPKPLRDLTDLVTGGAPRAWRVGWQEKWRQGNPPDLQDCSRNIESLLTLIRKEETK